MTEKADMSAAAKKAWKTRREKYGETGLRKKSDKKEEPEGERGQVQSRSLS